MKVFLIIPTMSAGGAERVMSLLANQWSTEDQIDVHLVLLAEAEDFYPISPSVTIHRLGFSANRGAISKALGILQTIYKLRKLIHKEKPQYALSFMNKYNITTILSCINTSCHVYISERDSPTTIQPKHISWLRKKTYPLAKGIISQTESYKRFIQEELYNKNVKVIPNPVKDLKITESPKEKIIICVGRLIEGKGHVYLLDAFSKIKNHRDWRLVILGDGPLKEQLQSYARMIGLSEKVDFKGAVKDIDPWLSRASVFAFPSMSEGFPNALAEAMAAGLACVSFDCIAGPRDLIIHGKNGFLVPTSNSDELAKHIDILISDQMLRETLSLEARNIGDRLSAKKICREYLEFIREPTTH